MKIQVLSDLHNEFSFYKIKIHKDADVLVLAGDIVNADSIDFLKSTFKKIDIPVIYIAGNHEFYTKNNNLTKSLVTEKIKEIVKDFSNVHFLDNSSIEIDGVRFIGSTLWSDFNLSSNQVLFSRLVNNAIGDFYLIRKDINIPLSGADCANLCLEAKDYIDAELNKQFNGKTVVVTHFCSHPMSIAEQFLGNSLNPYFITDCTPLIREPVSLWIHGHTHASFDYTFNGVRVFCNPRGYYNENKHFQGKSLVGV